MTLFQSSVDILTKILSLVRPAFKMRVYLGRIVELDREPTYEVGPKLAIYRSAAGCDERRGRRGELGMPEYIIDIR